MHELRCGANDSDRVRGHSNESANFPAGALPIADEYEHFARSASCYPRPNGVVRCMTVNGNQNQAIKNVLAAISVESPYQFNFAGRSFPVHGVNHQHVHHGASPAHAQVHPLVMTLSAQLYEFAYSRPFRDKLPEPQARDFSPDAELIEALSAANATRERW